MRKAAADTATGVNPTASGGPARDRTRTAYGPAPASAATSAISPLTAQRTTVAP